MFGPGPASYGVTAGTNLLSAIRNILAGQDRIGRDRGKAISREKAVMLVHSFSQAHLWFDEFCDFAKWLNVHAELNKVHHCGQRSGVDLYIGWIVGDARYLTR